MKKYQQGGVNVFNPINVNTPDVGQINPSPIIRLPEVPEINLPTMANMALDVEQRRRRLQVEAKERERDLSTTQKEFYELTDQLFGEVHNPYQMEVLTRVKAKYGIDDDFYAKMNTSDYFQLKSETDRLYKAVHDPEALRVIGEVEAAKKYMERPAPLNLTEEELAEAENYRAQYMTAGEPGYDVTLLDKNKYKRPAVKAPPNPKDLSNVTHKIAVGYNRAIDWEDPAEVEQFANFTALNWHAASSQTAQDLGYIVIDDAGNPILTDLGREYAILQGKFANEAAYGKRQDKIEDATTMAQTRDQIADGNRTPKPTSTTVGKEGRSVEEVDTINRAWNVILSDQVIDQQFGGLDPWTTPGLADAIKDEITKGAINIQDPATKKRIIATLKNHLRNVTPQTTTPQPAGAAGTTVIPTKTPTGTTTAPPTAGKKKWDPVTKSWKYE